VSAPKADGTFEWNSTTLRSVKQALSLAHVFAGPARGFLRVAALCEAHHIDLSGHCAHRDAERYRL
jgi:hypothetical protein